MNTIVTTVKITKIKRTTLTFRELLFGLFTLSSKIAKLIRETHYPINGADWPLVSARSTSEAQRRANREKIPRDEINNSFGRKRESGRTRSWR